VTQEYETTPGYKIRDDCAERAAAAMNRDGRTQTVLNGDLVDVLSYADRLLERAATAGQPNRQIHENETRVVLAMLEARLARDGARTLLRPTWLLVLGTWGLALVTIVVALRTH
jgi:hypothetical protein